MMNTNDVIRIFTELGWAHGKDEVGDDYCEIDLGGFTLGMMPKVKELMSDKVLRISYALSALPFTQAVSGIMNKKTSYEPFSTGSTSIRASDFTRDDILAEVKKAIAWGESESYENTLMEYRKNCPDYPGLMQVYHLAALALAGDVKKLYEYQLNFERGETQNFVPMIKKEMLILAAEIASVNQSKSI
jgi:hypothetical protein